jgi:predicted GH43/DUF377 family glycosyl hydrolase
VTMRPISPMGDNPPVAPLLDRCNDYNVGRFIETPNVEIVKRVYMLVSGLDENAVSVALRDAIKHFGERHDQLRLLWREHAVRIARVLPEIADLDEQRRDLVGAYFTMEYSLASAALFNPSIVLHPNPTDAQDAARRRILLSLRAVGEGHVSTILFREGWLEADGSLTLDAVSPPWTPYSLIGKTSDAECGFKHEAAATFDGRGRLVQAKQLEVWPPLQYEVTVPSGVPLSQCVFLPVQKTEKNGMEDVRMVEFRDNGKSVYYGTYTAYNGQTYWPQLIETGDFRRITIKRLTGKFSRDKGMALFPRLINGRYAMISRHDGHQMHLLWSDNVDTWDECEPIRRPLMPWEFYKSGNCGSPIETEQGWLLLTHGVGPMREYCIGAMLLDLDQPSRVLRYTPQPILRPPASHRNGYVPNVMYTCGFLLHRGRLTVPVGISDESIAVTTFELDELLESMQPNAEAGLAQT